MRRLLPLLFSLLAGAPAAAAPTGAVPMELTRSRHIVVSVKINDAGPFRLIFDTGSPLTFIGGRAALKAGLITPERAKQPTFFGMRGSFPIKRLTVGDVEVKDLSLTVLDHPIIDLLSQYEGPIDGIVGYSFFGRFRTTIDYPAAKITFVPVDHQPQDVMTGLTARIFAAPERKVLAAPALWGLEVDRPDENPGVRVTRVYAGSAAAAAGLKTGDRLTLLDGQWTDSLEDLHRAMAEVKAGQSAELRIGRAGQELTVRVKPRAGL